MNLNELCQKIYQISHLTGEFKLRSGQISHEYFDKYQFESDPFLLKAIASHLAQKIPQNTEVLAGLEMGGIPIATALSFETGLPVAFIRKTAKNYGTCRLAEGASIQNKNTLIVEDVITTGGQVAESTMELRKQGALIQDVICVINRANEKSPRLQELQLNQIELFTMNDLKQFES